MTNIENVVKTLKKGVKTLKSEENFGKNLSHRCKTRRKLITFKNIGNLKTFKEIIEMNE